MRVCNIDDKTRIVIKRTGRVNRKIHFLWQTLDKGEWGPAHGSFVFKAGNAKEIADSILAELGDGECKTR